MTEHALAAYTLRVHKRREPTTFRPLDDFDGSGSDLLIAVHGFLAWVRDNPQTDEPGQRVYEIDSLEPDHRRLRFHSRAGEYGVESTMRNRHDPAITSTRTGDDVEFLALRSLLFVPRVASTAILLTERVGQRGQHTSFKKYLTRAFSVRYPDSILEIDPVAPEGAFRKAFDQGSMNRIRLVRHSIPPDLADRFDINIKNTKDLGSVTTIIKPPRGLLLNKKAVQDALDSGDTSALLTIGNDTYDEFSVDVRVGGSTRTLNVTTGKPPSVVFPLPGPGRPADEDAFIEAKTVLEDLSESLALTPTLTQDFEWTNGHLELRLPLPDGPIS